MESGIYSMVDHGLESKYATINHIFTEFQEKLENKKLLYKTLKSRTKHLD